MLTPGSQAPDFALRGVDPTGAEQEFRLSELLKDGKHVVLYFYPKDSTPGCTNEACDFRDLSPDFQDQAVVVGVSPDSVASHVKFQTRHQLNFSLLSDPMHQVLTAYGAWGEKKLYGKTHVGVIRSTYVIAPDGTIRQAHRNVKVKGHAQAVLQQL
ncbi:MAG TPA: peroxiredoxin [Stenomitos sp.]